MLTGALVLAPNGFGALAKDVTYYFLSNNPCTSRVLLVRFHWRGKGQPKAFVVAVPRSDFEAGLGKEAIVVSTNPFDLPPWLESLRGRNLASEDAQRVTARKSHRERVESRLLLITPALDNENSILSADELEAEINAYARRANPPQNESRFRLWFLTYLCFGRNIWALRPPFQLAGHWDRERCGLRKQGAPSRAFGKGYGHRMTQEMAELCIKGYVKFMSPGKTIVTIYADAMTKVFGCKRIQRQLGIWEFFHPHGNAFPSERQFRYQVNKSLGKENVQKNRYGSERYRRRLAPSKGKFSADVSNLMEKVEADGYFTAEKPKGYLEGSVLPPLCVVVARDMLSGAKLGIGFSFGKETGTAYRMMLFSMAVPKEYFCRLWGIKLKPGDWSTEGMSPHLKVDRGPGSSQRLIELKEARPTVRSMTQSWSGQAKATVESSHPRDVHFEGEPTYLASRLTPVELARREIYRLIRYNHTADMSARMQMDRDLEFVAPTPHALWDHYAKRLRTSGLPISIEDAVRAFLTPVVMKVRKDGVYLDSLCYTSKAFRDSGLLERVASEHLGEIAIQGYLLDLCIRHVWIEVNHQIMQLDAQLVIREDEELLFVSLAELEQWKKAQDLKKSVFRVHKAAAMAEYSERFEEETGARWDASSRKSGRAKKGAVARQEELEVRQHTSQRKTV